MSKKTQEDPNQLAERILSQLDTVLCVKLRELKDDLVKLRDHFKDPKVKKPIARCKTWAEFCENQLRRTDRAVRNLLNERAKHERKPAEETSAGRPEVTLENKNVERRDDLTRRVKALFDLRGLRDPKERSKRKDEFIHWLKSVAEDLGIVLEIAAIEHVRDEVKRIPSEGEGQ